MYRFHTVIGDLRSIVSVERPQLRIQDTLKKNSDTVHFCISQDGYPKRASQDYANDVRIIISTSLNFAQIRKKAPKTPKLQFLESAQPVPKKRLDIHKK